jgi:ureidoacrylate peracid hydrolase
MDYQARGEGEMPVFLNDAETPALVPAATAVIVVDMLNWQVTRGTGMLGGLEKNGVDIEYLAGRVERTVVPNLQRLIAGVRSSGGRVVYLRVGAHAADYSDGQPHLQRSFRNAGARDGQWACEVIESLRPLDGDLSMIKTGSSGFLTSNLHNCLRNMGIDHLLFTGVVTNGCVLSTLMGGWELGYYCHLLTDATASFSQRLQDYVEEMVSGYLGAVSTTDEVLAKLGQLDESTVA